MAGVFSTDWASSTFASAALAALRKAEPPTPGQTAFGERDPESSAEAVFWAAGREEASVGQAQLHVALANVAAMLCAPVPSLQVECRRGTWLVAFELSWRSLAKSDSWPSAGRPGGEVKPSGWPELKESLTTLFHLAAGAPGNEPPYQDAEGVDHSPASLLFRAVEVLVDEVCQRAQQVQPADDGPPDDRPTLDDVPRGILSLPAHFRPGCGRFWHEGCNGKANPRAIKKMPSRPPNVRIGRDEPPRQLTHGRTHEPLRPPSPLVELEMMDPTDESTPRSSSQTPVGDAAGSVADTTQAAPTMAEVEEAVILGGDLAEFLDSPLGAPDTDEWPEAVVATAKVAWADL
ncbi:hypothetical protein AK812_SmicGene34687 [Symbiodinium microadriaticum]|uniref:Uncharacterized protein n=1 Tax=Symbiodinium microadriaticum TaxID=2951 RepID=A0A1Q9CND9_SYMMI|nr:hypothetical protein AK812_SmicGene34687 [Symbiodinium microadriaticum]